MVVALKIEYFRFVTEVGAQMPVEIDFYHFLHIAKVLKHQKNLLKDIVVFTIPTPESKKKKIIFVALFVHQ